jgi:dihydroflavonol-4-reductase
MEKARTEIGHVLAAVKRSDARRLVYTSSLTTIGAPPEGSGRLADERDLYKPGSVRNAYYEAKWVMERAVLEAAANGLDAIALVPTAVFGPGDVKPATGQVLLDLAQGRMPVSVHAESNFIDVREVALAHIRAADKGKSGERYILGAFNMDIADALRIAAEACGVKPPGLVLSRDFVVGLLKVVGGLPLPIPELLKGLEHWQPLNCEKGLKTFELTPRPFAETARDAVEWFRENGYFN